MTKISHIHIDLDISDIYQTHNVFILASTTGDGDAPFHAENFKQTLENSKNLDLFKGLNFAVFALGSSMYENFCEFGKFCHKTIKSLGGRNFVDLGLCDDQTDQEKSFQVWAQIAILNLCSINNVVASNGCLLYTSPSPRDLSTSRMPSSA